tara:strand:- start:523 stop:1116 length:594 start_codon:yes stop_codon:yes gene_type:complete
MHLKLCICGLIEPLTLATRVVVLTHARDECKPTNTSRLVSLSLRESEVRTRGVSGSPMGTEGLLDPARTNLLLFPGPDSIPLCREDYVDQAPVTLIVPDGTWRQARKVRSRVEGLSEIPCVRLAPGPPSRYRLRSQIEESRISTFEAVARALGELEGLEVQTQLEAVFEVMVERTLWVRGQLPGSQVAGGIPPGAQQ